MSCKSAIYTANTAASAITLSTAQPTSTIPLGTTIRRFGCNIKLNGTGILLDGEGYYNVNASVTLTPASTGDYTVRLLADGVEIPGANQTVSAASLSSITFNIPTIVRLLCCKSSSTLSLQVSATATLPATITVNNVGVTVTKI